MIAVPIIIIVLCFIRVMYLEEKTQAGEYFSNAMWWFFTGDDRWKETMTTDKKDIRKVRAKSKSSISREDARKAARRSDKKGIRYYVPEHMKEFIKLTYPDISNQSGKKKKTKHYRVPRKKKSKKNKL